MTKDLFSILDIYSNVKQNLNWNVIPTRIWLSVVQIKNSKVQTEIASNFLMIVPDLS